MRKVLSYMKPYIGSAVSAIFFTTVNSAMNLLLPNMMSEILTNGISDGRLGYIYVVGSVMVLISLFGIISAVIASYSSAKTAAGFGMQVRKAVFHKVETLSQNDIDKIGTSSLITRSTNDIRQIQELLLISLRIIIAAPIMMVGGAFMAFTTNKALSTVLFVVLPIIVIIALLIMKKVMPLFSTVQKKTDELNQVIRERLGGVRVIRAFNKSDYEKERFDKSNTTLATLSLKINRIFAVLIPLAYFLLYTTVGFLVYFGSKQVDKLDAVADAEKIASTVGDLQAFVIYILLIIAAVAMAASMFVMVPKASISAKRIEQVLNTEPSIKDADKVVAESGEKSITFENVYFGYDDAEEPVLSDISFTARPGEVTAIIGGTGSGKSTLVNLIPRFYDATAGCVKVNGVDVREIPFEQLHNTVSFVPQKALLFSGTIEDNLRFGKENASTIEMWKALETAQADSFVKDMPRQLKSAVSQNATNYSGGQKQRLTIARALIRKADFYVFDDSFSALDFKTDAMLRRAIRKDMAGAGLIIVAQRVGTIIDADNIIVMDEGKIAAQGKHAELVKNSEVYREICQSQLGGECMVQA